MKKDELVTERMQRFINELKPSNIRLLLMTAEMYRSYFMEYENDPDLYLEGQEYTPYTFSEEKVSRYVFNELDIPTLFADTIKTNTRSQHVLEKVGFTFIREDENFKYYRIDRDSVV